MHNWNWDSSEPSSEPMQPGCVTSAQDVLLLELGEGGGEAARGRGVNRALPQLSALDHGTPPAPTTPQPRYRTQEDGGGAGGSM